MSTLPYPSPWQPLIGRLSVNMPTLDTSHKGNPSICGLWERLSFSVFRAHPGGGTLFLFIEECSLSGHLLLRSSVDGQYSAPSLAFSKLTLSCHSHVNVGMALGCGRHQAQHETGQGQPFRRMRSGAGHVPSSPGSPLYFP